MVNSAFISPYPGLNCSCFSIENQKMSCQSSIENIQSETDTLLRSKDGSQDNQRTESFECMDSTSSIMNLDCSLKLDFLDDGDRTSVNSDGGKQENPGKTSEPMLGKANCAFDLQTENDDNERNKTNGTSVLCHVTLSH